MGINVSYIEEGIDIIDLGGLKGITEGVTKTNYNPFFYKNDKKQTTDTIEF